MIATEHMTEPCAGYVANGDAVVVRNSGGVALVAVVDALGHGPGAQEVATRAVAFLSEGHLDESVAVIMQHLHEALRGTRGAAAMVCLLRDGQIEGCGVGNIELRCVGANVPVVQSPGILGVRVRRFNIFSSAVPAGTRLIYFSDGISSQMSVGDSSAMGTREACETMFRRYRRSHDDATILVVDVKG